MAQKSKAASLTPDLLLSKSVPSRSTPRKQATDLSLAPGPAASQSQSAKAAAPPPAKASNKSSSKAKEIEPARRADVERTSHDVPTAAAPTVSPAAQPASKSASTPASAPAEPDGGTDKAVVAEAATADANSDDRIRIPVPLDPSEHLELTLAAARSGRSCQEIIVEALFRYLDDIAGSLDRPDAPGPDGPR